VLKKSRPRQKSAVSANVNRKSYLLINPLP
jgi:hypothetical protein